MLRSYSSAVIAVISFSLRKYFLRKARRTNEHFANARNFDNVYADGNNH